MNGFIFHNMLLCIINLKLDKIIIYNRICCHPSCTFFFLSFGAFFCVLVFDQLDLVTYEEVVKLPAFKRKTLVLLGNLQLFFWNYSYEALLMEIIFLNDIFVLWLRCTRCRKKTHKKHTHHKTSGQICLPHSS